MKMNHKQTILVEMSRVEENTELYGTMARNSKSEFEIRTERTLDAYKLESGHLHVQMACAKGWCTIRVSASHLSVIKYRDGDKAYISTFVFEQDGMGIRMTIFANKAGKITEVIPAWYRTFSDCLDETRPFKLDRTTWYFA